MSYMSSLRSSEIEILVGSRDGKEKKTDEVIHEEEVVVRIDREIHKFYCIPTDLETMIVGNLKSRGIGPFFAKIRKIADSKRFNIYSHGWRISSPSVSLEGRGIR